MNKRGESATGDVERLLGAIEPHHRRCKVREAVDSHFGEPGRSDGRGRKSSELKQVATTLRHIIGMQRWVADPRYDLNVRRRIKDFLKHIDHTQPWRQTVIECRRARGLANGAARSQNERKEFGSGEPTVLDETHTNYPLNSVAKMRGAGKRGGNCLRDNDYGHFDELRRGEAEFYEIRKSGTAVAWWRVERESREITDIYGPSNEDADLPVEVLWRMCREMDANGDGDELFLQNGVLSMFLDEAVDQDAPMRVVRGYRFWWRRREIVVHDSQDDRWSRFVWRRTGWRARGPSQLDSDTLEVMQRLDPAISSLARDAQPRRKPRRRNRASRGRE